MTICRIPSTNLFEWYYDQDICYSLVDKTHFLPSCFAGITLYLIPPKYRIIENIYENTLQTTTNLARIRIVTNLYKISYNNIKISLIFVLTLF